MPLKKVGEKELEKIKEMRLKGATAREIAKALNIHIDTAKRYLRKLGLNKRVSKCQNITREELYKLFQEGAKDTEIAKKYGVSIGCITQLKRKYGLFKRDLWRQKNMADVEEKVKQIAEIIKNMGMASPKELGNKIETILRKRVLTDHIYEMLRKEGIGILRLTYRATSKYTVLKPGTKKIILYSDPDMVAKYIVENIRPNTPLRAIRYILRANGAPKEIIDKVTKIIAEKRGLWQWLRS